MEFEVHVLDYGTVRADLAYMLAGHGMGSAADPDPETEMVDCPVWGLLVDHPDATVLWDTGSHPAAGEGYWPDPLYAAFEHVDARERDLPTALDEAGYGLGDVDRVAMSHLHVDHAGDLHHFADRDVPVYVQAAEIEYAYLSANTDAGSIAYHQPDFDHDLDWRLLRGDARLLPGVECLHLPGHTPGLMGLLLRRDDGAYVVAGDEAYRRENYLEGVPLGPGLIDDSAAWRDSLHRVRDLARRHDAPVFCGHDFRDTDRMRSAFGGHGEATGEGVEREDAGL